MRRRAALAVALALVAAAPALAAAQPAAAPEAPPAELPSPPSPDTGHGDPIHTEGGEGHGAAATEHHHEDPSTYFNWTDGIPFGYRKLDKAGGPLGDGKLGDQPLPPNAPEEPMSAPFVLMIVNFLILLVILGKYGAPAARKLAETRSDQIKSALDEAARLRDEAKAKLDEYGTKLAAADAEMTQMIERVRADAEADRQRVIAAAEAQAAALKKDAEERIAAEITLARLALAREVAAASAAATEQLIRAKATSADQTRLVDTFIGELGSGAAKRPEERS